MICGHPECTGSHNNSRPRSEWCPAQKERWTEALNLREKTPGTYAYNAIHGIGKAGMKKRETSRRFYRTAKGMLLTSRQGFYRQWGVKYNETKG